MKQLLILFFLMLPSSLLAQNYDESKVPAYQLPPLLEIDSTKKITTTEEWEQRREEILALFEEQMYGRVQQFDYQVSYEIRSISSDSSLATQEEVVITIQNDHSEVKLNMLLTLPKTRSKAVPIFLGLNFQGNQATHPNPEITLTKNYVIGSDQLGVIENKATEQSRGARANRWPVDSIIQRGYGLATIHCGDIDPDFDDGFENGVHSLLPTRPQPDQWGTIAAWAWGLSRAMDYFESDFRIDTKKVAVIGHSRLGKAALWAGATDNRFALVVSNNSGCGGAALSRRGIGETVAAINDVFPHWFCGNFHQYNDNEDQLPVDQHMLMSLIAPRPVYVASAEEDRWADPKGEYTSLYQAGPVFELFGFDTFQSSGPPQIDNPISTGVQGYHIRTGKHDITPYDWQQYLNFADSVLFK